MLNITKLNIQDETFNEKHALLIQDWVINTTDLFMKTQEYKLLTEEAKSHSRFIINSFCDYCYNYFLVSPDKLSAFMIQEIMLEIIPSKRFNFITPVENFEGVITLFYKYLSQHNIYSNLDEISNAISKHKKIMIEKVEKNIVSLEMAKSFFM